MAASTHPCAQWRTQLVTPKECYERFAATYQESIGAEKQVEATQAMERRTPVMEKS